MSFAGDSFRAFIFRVLMILFAIVNGIIHARWLGTDGVGVIALVLLLKNFVFQYGNLGFGSAFAYFLAQREITLRRIQHINWFVSIILSFISVVILSLVWKLSFSPWKHLDPLLFYTSLLVIPLFFINTHNQRILSGRLKITALNMVHFVNGLSSLVFLVLLVIIFKHGLYGAVLAILFGELIAFVYSNYQCVILNREEPADKIRQERFISVTGRLWEYGRWSYLLTFANFLVQELPLMIFSSVSGNTGAIGIFSKGRELGRQTRTLSIPIAQVLFPYTAASSKEKAIRRTNTTCRLYLAFLGVVMIFAVPLIKPAIQLLYGQEFLPSAIIFYILVPGVIAWPLGNFLEIHIAAAGQPRIVFFINLISLLFSGFAGMVLVKEYGLAGIATAVSLVLIMQFFLRYLLYRKLTGSSVSDVFIMSKSDVSHIGELLKKWKKIRQ